MSFHNNTLIAQSILLAMAVIGFTAQNAFAGFPLGNAVTMGGDPVFSIKAPADGFSPEHRAQLAQDNLDNALATAPECSASLVNVERINGATSVTFNGHLVATPDAASARAENLTAEQLAQKWADGIKAFFTDQQRSISYRNSLIGLHPLQGSIAYIERRLYVPGGTVLPVVFEMPLRSDTIKAGDLISGTVNQDVSLGHFFIPAGSTVSGKAVASQGHELTVAFTELKTPNGTVTPINASIANTYLAVTEKPHPVCTLSMPADLKTGVRVPATIAIGAPSETTTEQLTFLPGSHFEISQGQQVSVILNEVTPVALVERGMAM